MIEYVMRIIQNVFNNVNTAAETPLGETVVSHHRHNCSRHYSLHNSKRNRNDRCVDF